MCVCACGKEVAKRKGCFVMRASLYLRGLQRVRVYDGSCQGFLLPKESFVSVLCRSEEDNR